MPQQICNKLRFVAGRHVKFDGSHFEYCASMQVKICARQLFWGFWNVGHMRTASHTERVIFYSQWGLSLAPARRSSLAMGTLLVMMAMSRGRRPSLFGVLRSSSSKLYWDKSSCTKSSSWCSTASNSVSLLWNCYGKIMQMKLWEMKQQHFSQTYMLTSALDHIWVPTAALGKDDFFKNSLIFERDFIVSIKTKEELKVWFITVNMWGTDTVQVASLLMFFSFSDLLW